MSSNRNYLTKSAGAMICILVASCSGLSQPAPDKAYFAIDPGPFSAGVATSRPASTDAPALLIRGLHVTSPYDGFAFVYRLAGDQFRTDYYNNFVSPPDQMLTSAITSWFAHDPHFAYVGDSTTDVPVQFILSGNVIALYGDYTDPHAPKAFLSMRLLLKNSSSKEVFQREYSASAPIEPASAKSLVQGWNRALRQILQHLTADLGR